MYLSCLCSTDCTCSSCRTGSRTQLLRKEKWSKSHFCPHLPHIWTTPPHSDRIKIKQCDVFSCFQKLFGKCKEKENLPISHSFVLLYVCHQLLHPATLGQLWDKLFSRIFLLNEVSLVHSDRRLGCTRYGWIPLVCFIFSFLSYAFCTPKTRVLGLHLSVCSASLTACS